jgi:hypothetical protein
MITLDTKQSIDLYDSGWSMRKVADKVGVKESTLRYRLNKAGVKFRRSSRRSSLNESVFETLNPESEYWIGFLLSDGCIYIDDKKSQYVVALGLKDLDHIIKFKLFMGSSHSITIRSTKQKSGSITMLYTVSFNSKKVCSDLAKYNVIPRKSLVAEVHPDLQFSRDFWRGMIDGDGCLTQSNGKRRIQLDGTFDVVGKFRKYLDDIKIKYGKFESRGRGLFRVAIHGLENTNVLHNVLYSKSATALLRKEHHKAFGEPVSNISKISAKELLSLQKQAYAECEFKK